MNNVQKAVVIVIAVVLCAGVAYTVLGNDDGETSRFDEINLLSLEGLQEMSPTEALDGLTSRADTLVSEASDGNLSRNAMSMYVDELMTFYDDTLVSYMLFTWEYNRDPSGLSEEYSLWESFVSQGPETISEAFRSVLNGPGVDTLRSVIGDEYADSVLAEEPLTDEELQLITAEAEAQDRYYNADPSDAETIAGIYGELIDIRENLAGLLGYESYSEYAYEELYGRGYSSEDTEAFKETVKEVFVPLFYLVLEDYEGRPSYSYSSEEELFADGGEFIRGVCPEFAELYDTMLGYDLIDFEDLDTKVDTGFCFFQALSDGSDFVYIYNNPNGTYYDLCTLVHEFGHASAAALSWSPTTDYDVMEVQSQGLEALFSVYCEMLGDTAEAEYTIFQFLYVTIEGCFWDDFQLIAYQEGADTVDEFDAIIERLEQEYGVCLDHRMVRIVAQLQQSVLLHQLRRLRVQFAGDLRRCPGRLRCGGRSVPGRGRVLARVSRHGRDTGDGEPVRPQRGNDGRGGSSRLDRVRTGILTDQWSAAGGLSWQRP